MSPSKLPKVPCTAARNASTKGQLQCLFVKLHLQVLWQARWFYGKPRFTQESGGNDLDGVPFENFSALHRSPLFVCLRDIDLNKGLGFRV